MQDTFDLIHWDFHKFDGLALDHYAESIANYERSEPQLERYSDIEENRYHFKRRFSGLAENRFDRLNTPLDGYPGILALYSLVGEFGLGRLHELMEDAWDDLDEDREDYLEKGVEIAFDRMWTTVGEAQILEYVDHIERTGEPTDGGYALMYELGALHDEHAEPYYGECYFRRERIEEFENWRPVFDDHLDEYLSDRHRDLSPVERDAIVDHVLLDIETDTYLDVKDRTDDIPSCVRGMYDHVGRERVVHIADEVAGVDVSTIDVHTEVFDEALREHRQALVQGTWPDWDLDVLPEYVRVTRGDGSPPVPGGEVCAEIVGEPSTDTRADADSASSLQERVYDPSEPPINPPRPVDGPFSTRTARNVSPETIAAYLNVDPTGEAVASAYRIQRIVPSEEAMLFVDTLRGELRWVDMPPDSPYRPETTETSTQGNLIFGAIEGWETDRIVTTDPPAPEDRWTLVAHERVADTTISFIENVTWVPDIVQAAWQQADDTGAGKASTFNAAGSKDYQLQVQVPPRSADPAQRFDEYRSGKRVLESYFDSLDDPDVPAWDIVVALTADQSLLYFLLFGPESTLYEDYMTNLRQSTRS